MRRRPIPVAAWALLALASLGLLTWKLVANIQAIQRAKIADAKAWKIDGPPCPTITQAQFLANHDGGIRRFDYEEVAFFRRDGHVECAPIYGPDGRAEHAYPVCQFTGPGDLMIRTPKGEWYFQPGAKQPATVSAGGGEPSCVLAAKITARGMEAARR